MVVSFNIDLDIPTDCAFDLETLQKKIVNYAKSLTKRKEKKEQEIDFEEEMLKEEVEPMTMDEINARIDEAEADIKEGRVISHNDVMRMIDNFVKTGKVPAL